jgi:hypothetical protein
MCGGKKSAPAQQPISTTSVDLNNSRASQTAADAAVHRVNAGTIVSQTEPASFGAELGSTTAGA